MNAEKFSSTVIPLYRELFAVAFTLIKDRDAAADIVQDAMVKLWNYRDMLDNVASVKGFAMVTLRNTAVDYCRRERPRDRLDDIAEPAIQPDLPDDVDLIYGIIDALPERQRRIMRMSALEGQSTDEISEMTGLNADNIRQILSRGRKKIRELYKKYTST